MKNIKTPILIFFNENQIKDEAKLLSYKFPDQYIFKKENKVFVFLTHAHRLSLLQKNFLVFNIGKKLFNFCKNGTFYIDFFGDEKKKLQNLYLGWSVMEYKFEKFKKFKKLVGFPKLDYLKKNEINKQKKSIFFVRDLINIPANILGPSELFYLAKKFLGNAFSTKKISGKKLERDFPMIHIVGRASEVNKKPMLAEFKYERTKSKKKIVIIGKGVTFDTGGLNLKTGNGMTLMKKDMGGAANSIGLAKMLSESNCKFDIILLLALVENSLSAKSMRPSDIVKSRSGNYVEIGDTDAEGRLILADSITYSLTFKPDLVIDLATLTGSSRVALGTDVPSFFTNNELIAKKLSDSSKLVGDPLWQLPLWYDYENQLESNHADFKNIGNGGYGGAITAALFLNKFVKDIPWIHIDMMAWSKVNHYSSYEGGEAMGIRALLHFLLKNYN